MKTKLPSLLAIAIFFFSLAVSAQSIVTTDNIPQIGDHVVIGICSDIPDSAALSASTGTGQTWDFSSLIEIEEQYFDFVEPSTTPWSTQFPTSNICGISWTGSHTYYEFTSSELNTVGSAVLIPPSDTALMIYTNDETIVPIPYSHGTVNNTTFSGTSYALGFSSPFNGTLDFEADGDGTLILPNGTFPNVVRYHFFRTQTIGFNTTTKHQWAWVSEDFRFWLLLMESNFDGFSTSHLVWYDKNPESAGTSVTEIEVKNWVAYPNPVSSGAVIRINTDISFDQLTLLDLSGRDVKSFSKTQTEFRMDGVASGVYLLKIQDKDGAVISVQKLRVL